MVKTSNKLSLLNPNQSISRKRFCIEIWNAENLKKLGRHLQASNDAYYEDISVLLNIKL